MPLIKANNAPTSLSPFSMKDVEEAAKMVLLRARHQADRLLAQAQQAGEEIKAQARAEGALEGHAQGLAKGLAQGREEGFKAGHDQALNEQRAQLTQLAKALADGAQAIEDARRDIDAAALKDVIKLAIRIAERVTKRVGLLDPNVAVANVQEALKLVLHASDVRIAIHPDQPPRWRKRFPALSSSGRR